MASTPISVFILQNKLPGEAVILDWLADLLFTFPIGSYRCMTIVYTDSGGELQYFIHHLKVYLYNSLRIDCTLL